MYNISLCEQLIFIYFILMHINSVYMNSHLHTSFHREYKIWSHAAYIMNCHYHYMKHFHRYRNV